jgi:hypothetical protein
MPFDKPAGWTTSSFSLTGCALAVDSSAGMVSVGKWESVGGAFGTLGVGGDAVGSVG